MVNMWPALMNFTSQITALFFVHQRLALRLNFHHTENSSVPRTPTPWQCRQRRALPNASSINKTRSRLEEPRARGVQKSNGHTCAPSRWHAIKYGACQSGRVHTDPDSRIANTIRRSSRDRSSSIILLCRRRRRSLASPASLTCVIRRVERYERFV